MPRSFYKGFNGELKGRNDFQFQVGETYSTDTDDTWVWFHYAAYVSATLNYFGPDVRVCVVEPLGDTRFFNCSLDGYNKGYYTTNRFRVIRELSRQEIFQTLDFEKCPFYMILKLQPPYSYLLEHKNQIRGSRCMDIIHRDDLSYDERKSLLPKSQVRYLDVYYNSNS